MELRHLRYFIAVAEEQSFTKAAERLFIAQPPLSRQIKQLEEELELELFRRKSRGIELTEAGQYFLSKSRQILATLDTVVNDTRRVAAHEKRVFSVGFVPSVFIGELPQMVRRLRDQGKTEVMLHDLKTREQIEALKSGKIDIGFGRIFFDDPLIHQRVLYREPLLAAMPASHTAKRGPISMHTLSSTPMIVYPATRGPNFAERVEAMFSERGLKAKIVHQVNDVQTALALVASGMGCTLVPERWAKLHSSGVDYQSVSDEDVNMPVIVSRRKGDESRSQMQIIDETLSRHWP